jgi:hypothetical protein
VLFEVNVVNVPAAGVVPPIAPLSIVTPLIALTVDPSACAVEPKVIDELVSFAFAIEPANIVLVTLPVSVVYTPFVTVPALPPMDKLATAVVEATVNGAVPVATVDVTVVNLPVLAVVPPIAGGLDKSSVPPKVKLPELVTVPVKVKPLTVPVPLTDVTVPVVGVLHVGALAPLEVKTCPEVPAEVKA